MGLGNVAIMVIFVCGHSMVIFMCGNVMVIFMCGNVVVILMNGNLMVIFMRGNVMVILMCGHAPSAVILVVLNLVSSEKLSSRKVKYTALKVYS